MVTSAQLQNALEGLRQAVAIDLRWERRTRGGLFLADVTHAWVAGSGYVEADNARAAITAGEATFFADGLPALADLDQLYCYAVVKVRPRGQTAATDVTVPVGLFRPAFSTRRHHDDGRPLLVVRLQDQTSHLLSEKLTNPISFPAGTPYFAAMRGVLESRGLRAGGIPSGGPLTPLGYDIPPGATVHEGLRWLAEGINYFAPWPDREGIFTTRERVNPANVTPAVHYTDEDDGARMVDADSGYDEPLDEVTRKNRVVAKNEDPRRYEDGVLDDFGFALWENADPTSPVSTANITSDLLELGYDSEPSTRYLFDHTTLDAIARYELRREASEASTPELVTLADPRRGAREYVRVTVAGVEQAQLFRVLSWRWDFGSNTMRHRLARVNPVALTELEVLPE